MHVYASDHHVVELPAGHRFPMFKYAALRERLVARGVLDPEEVHPAPLAPRERIEAVHDPEYVAAFVAGRLSPGVMRRIGFPWSEELVRRTLASVGGTLAAMEAALDHGFAGNLAGGTHHAHRDQGSGFCVFNDIAVAARAALDHGWVRRVLVVDLDVHQGDGTAAIFAGDERVFTCSLHGARNFPFRKPPSDLDVPLADGTGDAAYLAALDGALDVAVAASRPDLVFLQGGADVLAEDRLGRLSLSIDGVRSRDARVFALVRRLGVPVVATLGGGYADPIDPTLAAHEGTYREARRCFAPRLSVPESTELW